MFDAIAYAPEVAITSNPLPVLSDTQRYCPVDIPRGRRMQYHLTQQFLPLVAHNHLARYGSVLPISDFKWKQEWDTLFLDTSVVESEEVFIPEDSLREALCEIVPGLRNEENLDMSKVRAWTPKEVILTMREFKVGSIVDWDDTILPLESSTRQNLGEGPFRVIIVNDFIAEFPREGFAMNKGFIPKHNHIVVQSIRKGNCLFAHPGYFLEHPEQK